MSFLKLISFLLIMVGAHHAWGTPDYVAIPWEDRVKKLAQDAAVKRNSLDGQLYCVDIGNCPSMSDSNTNVLTPQANDLIRQACDGFVAEAKFGLPVNADQGVNVKLDNPAGEAVLSAFNFALKDFLKNDCSSRFVTGVIRKGAQECLDTIKDSKQAQRLRKHCEERVRDFAFTPADDVDDIFANSIKGAVEEIRKGAEAMNQTGQSAIMGKANPFSIQAEGRCDNADLCFFLNHGGEDNCDLLDCTLANSELFAKDKDFSQLFSHFQLQSKEFPFKGNKGFCRGCLKKTYEQTPQTGEQKSFEDQRNYLGRRLGDKIAGKKAGRILLDWVGHIESVKDFQGLNKSSSLKFGDAVCRKEMESLLAFGKNPCGGNLSDAHFTFRLATAMTHSGIGAQQGFDRIVSKIQKEIDPISFGGNSCRESFAHKKRYTLNNIDNRKYKQALSFLFDVVNTHPEFKKLLSGENCESGKHPEISFPEAFGRKFSAYYSMHDGPKECDSDPLVGALVCGRSGEEFKIAPEAARFFKKLGEEVHAATNSYASSLAKIDSAGFSSNFVPGMGGALDEGFRKTKSYRKAMFEKMFENIFKVPMDLDPAYEFSLGSWENLCKLSKESKVSKRPLIELVDSLDTNKGTELAQKYAGSNCQVLRNELEQALCGEISLPDQESPYDMNFPFSVEDLEIAKNEVFTELSPSEQIAANSLSCDITSHQSMWGKADYSSEDKTKLGGGLLAGMSDYEKQLAGVSTGDGLDFVKFVNGDSSPEASGCNQGEYFAMLDSSLRGENFDSVPERNEQVARLAFTHTVKSMQGTGKKSTASLAELVAQDIERKEAVEMEKLVARRAASSRLIDLEVADETSQRGGVNFDNLRGKTGAASEVVSRAPASAQTSVSDEAPSRVVSSQEESVEPQFDESVADVSEGSQDQFQNLFGHIGAPVDSGAQSAPVNVPGYFNSGSLSQEEEKSKSEQACDKACLEALIQSSKEEKDKEELAQKAGLEAFPDSTQDMKKMFEDVLEGKLNNQELERLKEENKKLMEEMSEIKEQLANKAKTPKVLDSNGVDQAVNVPQPESNPAVVFNPRNSEGNEFRSRSFYDDKKEQLSPSFNDSAAPVKKVSLGEYSGQRRASAAKVSDEQVKRFNGDLDRSFLQSHSSSPVDDNFVRQYVAHLDKNAGSIEHLIVYENGRPAKIRVPDPKKPGEYLERPIAEDMLEVILEKVKKDELDSYALFNMVNFGQSLEDFVKALEAEKTDLTTLSSLNNRLDEMRKLEN